MIKLVVSEVHSGGDINWTGKALAEGFSLIYIPEAIVYYAQEILLKCCGRAGFAEREIIHD